MLCDLVPNARSWLLSEPLGGWGFPKTKRVRALEGVVTRVIVLIGLGGGNTGCWMLRRGGGLSEWVGKCRRKEVICTIGISMLLFEWRVCLPLGRSGISRNGENLLYRVVQSCDDEAKGIPPTYLHKQTMVSCCIATAITRKINLQVPDKVDGPCLDFESYKENPRSWSAGGQRKCVCV
jgi:hypothetical protein